MLVRMWRKGNTVGGNLNWCSQCGKQYGGFSEKIETPYHPAVPLLGIDPEKNENTDSKRYVHPNVHSIIYSCQYMEVTSVHQQKNGQSRCGIYVYTMECYSAIKKNEILPFATTWMDLEGIMLSEVSQTEKHKYCMMSLIYGI